MVNFDHIARRRFFQDFLLALEAADAPDDIEISATTGRVILQVVADLRNELGDFVGTIDGSVVYMDVGGEYQAQWPEAVDDFPSVPLAVSRTFAAMIKALRTNDPDTVQRSKRWIHVELGDGAFIRFGKRKIFMTPSSMNVERFEDFG